MISRAVLAFLQRVTRGAKEFYQSLLTLLPQTISFVHRLLTQQIKSEDLNMTYRPWMGRRIGVELEMNSVLASGAELTQRMLSQTVRGALSAHPSALPVRSEGYSHNSGNVWEVKTDGSCGYEVTTPAIMLDEEGDNAQLRDVCNALKTLRPRIDRRCGYHLHVEVRDYTWQDLQKFLALWTRYEPYFYEMLPPSRRHNTYCAPVRKCTWTEQDRRGFSDQITRALSTSSQSIFQTNAQGGGGRYFSVNLQHFWSGARLEFRLHSGTVDYVKIRNWAKLILAMVARVKHPDMPRIQTHVGERPEGFSTRYIFRQLGLTPSRVVRDVPASNAELQEWADARRLLFDPNAMNRPGRRNSTGRRVDRAMAVAEGDAETSASVPLNTDPAFVASQERRRRRNMEGR